LSKASLKLLRTLSHISALGSFKLTSTTSDTCFLMLRCSRRLPLASVGQAENENDLRRTSMIATIFLVSSFLNNSATLSKSSLNSASCSSLLQPLSSNSTFLLSSTNRLSASSFASLTTLAKSYPSFLSEASIESR